MARFLWGGELRGEGKTGGSNIRTRRGLNREKGGSYDTIGGERNQWVQKKKTGWSEVCKTLSLPRRSYPVLSLGGLEEKPEIKKGGNRPPLEELVIAKGKKQEETYLKTATG